MYRKKKGNYELRPFLFKKRNLFILGEFFSSTHKIPPESRIFRARGIFLGKNSPKISSFPFLTRGIYPISPSPKVEFFPQANFDILKYLSKVEIFVVEFY